MVSPDLAVPVVVLGTGEDFAPFFVSPAVLRLLLFGRFVSDLLFLVLEELLSLLLFFELERGLCCATSNLASLAKLDYEWAILF